MQMCGGGIGIDNYYTIQYNIYGVIKLSTFHRIKKEIGEKVISTYEHKCTMCNSTEDLCVHHKIKMKPSDERYNDIENLTVLCRKCHMAHHRKEKDVVCTDFSKNKGNKFGRRGKDNPIVTCSIEGCGELQHAKGYCRKHYRLTFPEKFYSKKDQRYRKNCINKAKALT